MQHYHHYQQGAVADLEADQAWAGSWQTFGARLPFASARLLLTPSILHVNLRFPHKSL